MICIIETLYNFVNTNKTVVKNRFLTNHKHDKQTMKEKNNLEHWLRKKLTMSIYTRGFKLGKGEVIQGSG